MLSNNNSTGSTGMPEPTTPENAPIELPPDSTPTVHKQSTVVPFTSGHVLRDETLIALGNEMVGYVVGPMPAKEFLKLLPLKRRTSKSSSKSPKFDKKPFAKLKEVSTEPEMYDLFIEAMKGFCPNLVGINTSNNQMTVFSGKTIKPDITYYNSPRPFADVEGAELMVEAKFNQEDDPFNEVPTAKGFLHDRDRARQTLGQVTSYATAHLAAQFRTHIFSILLFRKSARIMRWDRAGVIVSEHIPLDKPALTQFFWRFSKADAAERGHDPTVTPFKFTKVLSKKFLFDQLQFAADLGDVKMEDVKFFEVFLPRENNRYVIGKATYLGLASLASRATRSFKAWCLTRQRPVFLKDTWRILSGSLSPEHRIYEKLAAANVQYIATVLDHSDLEGHLTLTGDYAQESWVCKTNLKSFRTLQHYRLVLNEIGRSLTSFSYFREVLAAMRSALQAHRESYYNGHVLHRDISAGNILIYNDGGLLIDWDMSKDLDLVSDEKTISRTGTWAFQSLRLSQWPKENQGQVVHSRLDDLESFYHVLFWVALQHARHGLNPLQLYDVLTGLFDNALIDDGKAYTTIIKSTHMKSIMTVESVEFRNPPLLNLLLKLSYAFKVLYIPPPRRDRIGPPGKTGQQTGESYETELENYNAELRFLDSDKDSDWMEVYFENAIQFPDDEWGPTEYILNDRTPPLSAITNTKRKYSDMMTSNLRYNQGGTFSLLDQSAEADEAQDDTMNEGEDSEDDESDEESEEENNQTSSSRRRFN